MPKKKKTNLGQRLVSSLKDFSEKLAKNEPLNVTRIAAIRTVDNDLIFERKRFKTTLRELAKGKYCGNSDKNV